MTVEFADPIGVIIRQPATSEYLREITIQIIIWIATL